MGGAVDSTQRATAEATRPKRILATPIYLLVVALLGVVAFVANGPVFTALLPRDPAVDTTRDAYVLAAGVVVFLLIVSHFFGVSLRALQERRLAGNKAPEGTAPEDIVRLAISGLGFCLVVAVLFQARGTLNEVAADRFSQDSARIAEMSGSVSDPNVEDLRTTAVAEREAAEAMYELRFPVLLLNVALVALAILASFLHRGVVSRPSLSQRLSDKT
jgi:hypothetical protein